MKKQVQKTTVPVGIFKGRPLAELSNDELAKVFGAWDESRQFKFRRFYRTLEKELERRIRKKKRKAKYKQQGKQ